MSYFVEKRLHFCYGHRLLGYDGKCQWLHGHNAVAEIRLKAEKLDELGMVVDFVQIKRRLGAWIDENLDHRTALHKDDPLLPLLRERGEPIYATDENPTAEHLAKVLFDKAAEFGLPVEEVRFWETPDSAAVYRPNS